MTRDYSYAEGYYVTFQRFVVDKRPISAVYISVK